jgi:hypothetical protein
METFRQVIALLASIGILLTILRSYLQVNKVWPVRHEKSVAESISVASNLIALLPSILALIDTCFNQDWRGVSNLAIALALTVFYTLLGIGWWVPNERKKGFFRLLKSSLKKEKRSLGDLAKAIFIPNGADRIIEVLSRIALIDKNLDDREKEFIQTFANSWGVKISWHEIEKLADASDQENYIKLRYSIVDYLATSPSKEQVSQLSDVLNHLANIDDSVSEQEELIISELCGMLANYVNGTEKIVRYEVNIVPQSDEQVQAMSTILTDAEKRSLTSGVVFAVGPFFSKHYADMMRDQYRSLGFFSVSTEIERQQARELAV